MPAPLIEDTLQIDRGITYDDLVLDFTDDDGVVYDVGPWSFVAHICMEKGMSPELVVTSDDAGTGSRIIKDPAKGSIRLHLTATDTAGLPDDCVYGIVMKNGDEVRLVCEGMIKVNDGVVV